MIDRSSIVMQSHKVMGRIFRKPPEFFTDHTCAADVSGWDSLSHLVLISALEKQFNVEIPAAEANAAQDVGQLIDLIASIVDSE